MDGFSRTGRDAFVAFGAASFAEADLPDQAQSLVVNARLDDQPITPATVRYLQRVFRESVAAQAECVVIELNTPGGLLQSTQELVTDILGSRVPVVVYVSPSGARAASGGVFIT